MFWFLCILVLAIVLTITKVCLDDTLGVIGSGILTLIVLMLVWMGMLQYGPKEGAQPKDYPVVVAGEDLFYITEEGTKPINSTDMHLVIKCADVDSATYRVTSYDCSNWPARDTYELLLPEVSVVSNASSSKTEN